MITQTKSILIMDILISVYVLLCAIILIIITYYHMVYHSIEMFWMLYFDMEPCSLRHWTLNPTCTVSARCRSKWMVRMALRSYHNWRLMPGLNAGEMTVGSILALCQLWVQLCHERESIVFSLCCAKKTALNCSTNKFSEIRIGKGKKQKVRGAPSSQGYPISDINESNDKEAKLSSETGLHTFYRIFTKAQMIWTPTQQPVPFNRNIT